MLVRRSLVAVLAAAFAWALPLGGPNRAYAALHVQVFIGSTQVDGTPGDFGTPNFVVTNGGNKADNSNSGQTYTAGGTTINDLSITISSNAPGVGGQGNLNTISATAAGMTGSSQTVSVLLWQDTAYTDPGSANPRNLKSSVSRADGLTGNTLTFQSWIAPGSGLGSSVGGNATFGVQTQDQSLSPLSSPNTVNTLYSTGGNYFLSEKLTFTSNFGSNNLSVNGSSSVTATPEPGAIAMALTGLPVLGLFWARRRRHA